MSYDLHLFRKTGPPLTSEEVLDVVSRMAHMEIEDEEFWFRPPGTELGFQLGVESDEDWGDGDRFEVYHVGKLIFCLIPYASLRAMEPYCPHILAYLCRKLNLAAYDHQVGDELSLAELGDSWCDAQKKSEQMLGHIPSAYESAADLSSERQAYVDALARHRDEIEGRWAYVDIYLPEIHYLRPANGGALLTVAAWPDRMSVLLPDVDIVAVHTWRRGLLGLLSGGMEGLVPMQDLVSALGSEVRHACEPVSHWICRPDKHPAIAELLSHISLRPFTEYRLIQREGTPEAQHEA